MSVKLTGCGFKYATLLHQAGFKNTENLSRVDPVSLYHTMEAANANYEVVTKLPSLTTLETWINEARNAEHEEITARGFKDLVIIGTGSGNVPGSATHDAFAFIQKRGKAGELIDRYSPGMNRGGKRGPGQDRNAETGLPGKDRRKKNWPSASALDEARRPGRK